MENAEAISLERNHVYLLCYTRTPLEDDVYSPKLAYSMHLAYSHDGNSYTGLNHNSGVLFAKATANDNGTLNAKSLKNPYLFHMADGTFGVIAERIEHDGGNDRESVGCILLFTSSDLIHYKEIGLIHLKSDSYVSDAICEYNPRTNHYEISWCDESGHFYKNSMPDITALDCSSQPETASAFVFKTAETDIEGAVERNEIHVPNQIGNKVITKLSALANTEIRVPDTVEASSASDLELVRAVAFYNDGSSSMKKVDWDTSHVDWDFAGIYDVKGTVRQDSYSFPTAVNRADPCVIEWNGKFLFIATNDDTSIKQGFYVRESATIAGIASAGESLILDDDMYPLIKQFFWAPEFHIIGNDLYIFFAVSSGEFGSIHSHVMKLKSGGNPVHADDWEMPIRMQNKDGDYMYESGITLDMTYFVADGKHFVIWAQRQLSPVDLGSWLYIANVDPEQPWRLVNDPVLLSKPEYGWANNHTFVDEGPFAIITKENIFVTFSSALVNATYCVGMMTAPRGADLLDTDSWTKSNYPLLTSRSVAGEYGPGHNAYISDGDGNLLNVYHARGGLTEPRSTGIRRVHFDIDGCPVLDLTEDADLNRDLRCVTTKVNLTKK
ncbi:family 43 glycosylhydrolase [Paenibacillus sp. LHD-38]|uniref:family 43 glycosylhydrolase n=1 Tax=Paenibacillus sp. LHD-38 TaxID=3072143 RepID=UPI00280E2BBA|nr:family 43 glycosylhydrolase [Paenibacillus sp. LHD-38]MDQ8735668.1 family 43 glycosylhydrolase [Paenibacillus sp. LHD-38]